MFLLEGLGGFSLITTRTKKKIMAEDIHKTNVLVDLTGLNKAYKTNKDRIDKIENGDTVVTNSTYAQKIGSSTSTKYQVGDTFNPVYVNGSGDITPVISSDTADFGDSTVSTINLGGASSVAETKSKDFTASSKVTSPEIKVSGTSNSVSLKYSNDLDALVFEFN